MCEHTWIYETIVEFIFWFMNILNIDNDKLFSIVNTPTGEKIIKMQYFFYSKWYVKDELFNYCNDAFAVLC